MNIMDIAKKSEFYNKLLFFFKSYIFYCMPLWSVLYISGAWKYCG